MRVSTKIIASIMAVFLLFSSLTAENPDVGESVEDAAEEVAEAIEEAAEVMEESIEEISDNVEDFDKNEYSDKNQKAYMGVYSKTLSLKDARELGYNEFYGILITKVVSGSAAEKQGIRPYDILMSIDGKKIYDDNSFSRFIDSYNTGDKVKLEFFSHGKIEIKDFVMGEREEKINYGKGNVTLFGRNSSKSKKYSTGYGGLSWIPVYFKTDLDDVNYLVKEFGFSKIDDSGIFLNGLGGKGIIGKSWFLGLMGVRYSNHARINKSVPDILKPGETVNVNRRMAFKMSYWGVTLDKRAALSRKFISSAGFMLGWGKYKLNFEQTYGELNWADLNEDFNSSYNNHIALKRSYILFQPKVMMMYRILSWLSVRAEVGYMASYSFKEGWSKISSGNSYEIKDSPNTDFNGLTFTIGPWFGF
ncbi:MAG: hypothetical protein CSB55_05840 [Candidatus Cloacimonadota bacterium]|nr:MAG: hypothetical protein CSB55_05840 [Candidatus Cloacimonadota bacterium]